MKSAPPYLHRPRSSAPPWAVGVAVLGGLGLSGCFVELPPVVDDNGIGGLGGASGAGATSPGGSGGSGGQGGGAAGGTGGTGGEACGPGLKLCAGSTECVEATPANGCGASDCQPCQRTGDTETAEFACSDQGQCVITSCDPGFGDCDGESSNGCERKFGDLAPGGVPLHVPFAGGHIVVDGERFDWEDFDQYALQAACADCVIVGDGTGHNVLTPGAPSRRDIDAYFRLAWDSSFLYVLAEAYDDQPITASGGNAAFSEDSFALMVDGLNNGTGFSDDDHIVYLSISGAFGGRNRNPDAGQVTTSAVQNGPQCYRVEAGVSWQYLVGSNAGSQLPPAPGKVYGFDLFVNDWDAVPGFDDPQRESTVFWTDPGNQFWINTAGFTEIKLSGAPDAGAQ